MISSAAISKRLEEGVCRSSFPLVCRDAAVLLRPWVHLSGHGRRQRPRLRSQRSHTARLQVFSRGGERAGASSDEVIASGRSVFLFRCVISVACDGATAPQVLQRLPDSSSVQGPTELPVHEVWMPARPTCLPVVRKRRTWIRGLPVEETDA